MKLRIRGDSLRLRLSPAEVRHLAEAGEVSDEMQVAPGASLAYGVRAADTEALAAEFCGRALTVLVPRVWVGPWAAGDTAGFSGQTSAGAGRTLSLLVETDAGCRHTRPGETDEGPPRQRRRSGPSTR